MTTRGKGWGENRENAKGRKRERRLGQAVILSAAKNLPGVRDPRWALSRFFAALRMTITLLMLVCGIARAERAEQPGPKPKVIEELDQIEKLGEQLPLDLPFVDSRGAATALGKCFDGRRPVILTMNYSACPRLCSLQLNGLFEGLAKLDDTVGGRFQMITVSIDPEETPAKAQATKEKYLAAYGRKGAAEGWHCLVGEEKKIRALADAVGFQYAVIPDTAPKQYAHAAVTIVLTPDGRVSRYLYGIEYSPTTLRMALLEAGEGKIGTTVERMLLFCFSYDPQAGSYTLAAVRLMQLGGLVTLAVLGGVLTVFWRREAKRSKNKPAAVEA